MRAVLRSNSGAGNEGCAKYTILSDNETRCTQKTQLILDSSFTPSHDVSYHVRSAPPCDQHGLSQHSPSNPAQGAEPNGRKTPPTLPFTSFYGLEAQDLTFLSPPTYLLETQEPTLLLTSFYGRETQDLTFPFTSSCGRET